MPTSMNTVPRRSRASRCGEGASLQAGSAVAQPASTPVVPRAPVGTGPPMSDRFDRDPIA